MAELETAWPPFDGRQGLYDRLALMGLHLAVLWALGRWLGFEFHSAEYLAESHQFLALKELADNLGQALWHLICNPPGYNLLIGLALKASRTGFLDWLWAWHVLWGCLGVWAVYGLARLLSGRRWPGLVLGAALPLAPDWLLYQSWSSYTFPVMAYALVLVHLACRYHRRRDLLSLIGLSLLLNLLMLTRAVYHLLFGLLLAGGLIAFHGRQWRRLVLVLVLPSLVLTGGWYFKNWLNYGFFGASSWYGIILMRIASHNRSRQFMVRHLKDTPQAFLLEVWPVCPGLVCDLVDHYWLALDHPQKGRLAVLYDLFEEDLDGRRRHRNLNNINYLAVSRHCAAAAGRLLRADPLAQLSNVLEAFRRYSQAATRYGFLDRNRPPLRDWLRLWEEGLFRPVLPGPGGRVTIFFYLYPAFLLWLSVRVACGLARGRDVFDDALIGGTLLFVIGVCITADLGENHRLSFLVLPLFLTALIGRLSGLGRRAAS